MIYVLTLVLWSSWTLVCLLGFCLFVARTSETGMTYVNLPRLLYFLWILVCVMFLAIARAPVPAALSMLLAVAVGLWAILGDEPTPTGRYNEILERVEGCKRALKENARNPASLELLGDAYSTVENKTLALKYWGLCYENWSNAKLLEKIECVKRRDPVFFIWGGPCARELRACSECERVCGRLTYSCPRCGEIFFPDRLSWASERFNRFYETTGAGSTVETGLAFLPFLFFCAPWAYVAAWLIWSGARRPGPESAA